MRRKSEVFSTNVFVWHFQHPKRAPSVSCFGAEAATILPVPAYFTWGNGQATKAKGQKIRGAWRCGLASVPADL